MDECECNMSEGEPILMFRECVGRSPKSAFEVKNFANFSSWFVRTTLEGRPDYVIFVRTRARGVRTKARYLI